GAATVMERGYVSRSWRSVLVRDRITQDAEAFDLHLAYIARLHVERRLAEETDSRRGAGDDHVANFERRRFTQSRDQRWDVEDQVGRIGRLHHVPVEARFQVQAAAARGKLIGRDQLRTEAARAIEVLAQCPLLPAPLKFTHGTVVEKRVTPHVFERLFLRDVAAGLADDDRELSFKIERIG